MLINLDSDVVFIRPFSPDILFDGDRLGLFEVDYRNDEIIRWSQQAARLTGLTAPETPNNHVGMMVGWWRNVACDLVTRIEAQTGLPWQIALGRCRSFSEYMTYGTFVHSGPGLEASRHVPDGRMLVQTSWHKDTGSDAGLADLFTSAPDDAVAVMVHSKDGLAPEKYARFARAMWSGTPAAPPLTPNAGAAVR